MMINNHISHYFNLELEKLNIVKFVLIFCIEYR